MGAVGARLRADFHSRWRAWFGLALLVGVTGAVVLAAAAAARRTESALPRLLVSSRAADALISPVLDGLDGFDADVARLPEVTDLGEVAGLPLAPLDTSGKPDIVLTGVPASVDGRAGYDLFRPKLLAGRMPDRDQAEEVFATRWVAERLQLRVGGQLTMLQLTPEESAGSYDPNRDHLRFRFTVVGIGSFPDTLVGSAPNPAESFIVTPAWFRANPIDHPNLSYSGAFIRIRAGADISRLRQGIDRLAAQHPETGGRVFFSTFAESYAAEGRAIRPQAVALGLFAALAGAATLLVVGQAFSRQIALGAGDHPTMRALGMSRAQLLAVSSIPATAAAAVGALLAALGAALASPVGPLGVARLVEPHPGVAVNLALLAAGAAVIVALLSAWVALPAWRASAHGPGSGAQVDVIHTSRLARATARSGLPPTAATGVRMAVEPGRGRTAVPVRGALVGGALAIAAMVAASSFVSDLGHLVSTPRLYGATWDYSIDAQFAFIPGGRGVSLFSSVPTVGLDDLRGHIFPTVVEGKAPTTPDEVVLGTNTLRRARRSVGQFVEVQAGDRARRMRIVGRAVFPSLRRGGFAPTDLGEGAATTGAAVASPDVPPGEYNFFLVRLAPGTDAKAAAAATDPLATQVGCSPGQCPSFVTRPAEIDSYARVRWTPLVLAGLLAVLAAGTMGHALITSVRRRRRDLAILKTLGFVRRQVSATVAWQATTLVALALLIGIPLGVAAGRWGWALFARQLGVPSETLFPLPALLITVPTTLVAANLIAAVPARIAARTRPAIVLRSE